MTFSSTETSAGATLVDVTMPQMGVSVAEGTIVAWRVEVGDRIGADQPICDISTDKIDTEVPAPVEGVVAEIIVGLDETVEVGTVLARIAVGSARLGSGAAAVGPTPAAPVATARARPPAAAAPTPAASPNARDRSATARNGATGTPPATGDLRRYSPVVQRIASEHGIDLSQIKGTGRGGRVRKQDVLAFIDATPGEEPPLHIESPYRPDPVPTTAPAAPAPAADGGQLSRMRRQIGEHMKRSLETAATCTTWIEVDMGRVEVARKRLGVTGLAFVARACVDALREFPAINATLEGEQYSLHHEINMGIAVSLGDDGLIVPVIQAAHELSVEGIAARIKDLARRARSRELKPDDVHGGTFTITNPGQYGSIMATPIINQPQVAILDFEAVDQAAGGRDRRRRQRLDRDPADDDPRAELGSPCARRCAVGAVPGERQAPPRVRAVSSGRPELWVCNLGIVEYLEALALQERIRAARQRDELPDVMLLLEHPPVYTRGRRSGPGELPMGEDWYRMQGFEIVQTDRGGKVTYHGPGQLVGYPIVRVDDVIAYLRKLESGLVAALAQEGVAARGRVDDGPDYTGVWVEDRKIASIGVHLARGVTTHGFAVNVENDLQPFEWVVACGLDGVRMTSLIKETRRLAGQMPCFRRRAAYQVAEALDRRQRLVSLARLEAATGVLATQ